MVKCQRQRERQETNSGRIFSMGNGIIPRRGPRLLTEVQLYRALEDLFGIEEARRLVAPPTEPVRLINPYDELSKFASVNEGMKGQRDEQQV
ncbi:MAG TPA: hypothetical protein VF914_05535 [Chloroflexia bacterium]|jgi:hypothetical protein